MSLKNHVVLNITTISPFNTHIVLFLIFVIWAYGKIVTTAINKSKERKANKAEAEKAKKQAEVQNQAFSWLSAMRQKFSGKENKDNG